jgi:hypothetical protein
MENNQSNPKRTRFIVTFSVLLLSAITGPWTLSARPLPIWSRAAELKLVIMGLNRKN